MTQITNQELIQKAKEIAKLHKCSEDVRIADVGCALLTEDNKLYLGVSIHACCGIGFCAEHSAIASMVLEQRYKIKKIVAVSGDGTVLPPCGRCRELMYEINEDNYETEIIIESDKSVKLKELLPEPWQKKFY
jgi:cytidine deaminase